MAATIPESIYRSSLDGCIHSLDLDYSILYYGWLRPYHIHHVFEILVVLVCAGFPTTVFSVGHVLIKHFTPLSLSRASCFRVHMLHRNLSPSLQSLVPHIGGPILWPVSSDMTWNHFHGIPLDRYNHSSEDCFLWKALKIDLLALARPASWALVPMGEIRQRWCANWCSVPVYYSS